MSDILAIVLSSGVTLFLTKEGVNAFKEWRKTKKGKFNSVLPKVSEVYEEMNGLLNDVGAGRVLILKAHNGGGRPAVGTQLYSSAVYEVWGDLSSVKDSWQNQPLDEEYTQLLVELNAKGTLYMNTVDMDDGVLKQLYFASHILHSVVVKIAQDEKNLYYMSINFHTPVNLNEPTLRESVRSSVNRLKQLWG